MLFLKTDIFTFLPHGKISLRIINFLLISRYDFFSERLSTATEMKRFNILYCLMYIASLMRVQRCLSGSGVQPRLNMGSHSVYIVIINQDRMSI